MEPNHRDIVTFYKSFQTGNEAQKIVSNERRVRNSLEPTLITILQEKQMICLEDEGFEYLATLTRTEQSAGLVAFREELKKRGFTNEQILNVNAAFNMKNFKMRLEVNRIAVKRKRDDENHCEEPSPKRMHVDDNII